MRFLKSLCRGLATFGFKLGLVLLALTTVLMMVFGTSGVIKQALRDSQVYGKALDSAINEVIKNQGGRASDQPTDLITNEPRYRQAASNAFTPAVIKDSSEQVIDGVYTWLRSDSAQPDFRVDLSMPKQKFAEMVADSALERARQLPVCTLQELRELASNNFDPFTVPCLPFGYNPNNLRAQAISDTQASQSFLKDPVITPGSFPKNSQGKSIFENFSQAPKIFQLMLIAPWITVGLTLLCGLALMLLHEDKRRGFRSIGTALLVSGVLLLFVVVVSAFTFSKLNIRSEQLSSQLAPGLQRPILDTFDTLSSTINSKLLWFGGIYITLGVIVMFALRFTRKKQPGSNTLTKKATSI